MCYGRAKATGRPRVIVDLLALAHQRTCERELAQAIEETLNAGRLPDPKVLLKRFKPDAASLPEVKVERAALSTYDELAIVHDTIAKPSKALWGLGLAPGPH